MKERPILFSAPMVRAILDGRKTQTRRVVKNQPIGSCIGPVSARTVGDGFQWHGAAGESSVFQCPYGKPGDRLWVREAFSGPFDMSELPPREWPEFCADASSELWFWADGNPPCGDYTKPKPSIHMPRWASRILLEIVNVRVERLQEISEADAMAEGSNPSIVGDDLDHLKYRAGFQYLWESINGPGSWDANPWVWVVEFKVAKGGAA